jgi:integrase
MAARQEFETEDDAGTVVDAAAIDDLVVAMRQLGLTNGTINRYLSALSGMLKRAQRLGMIDVMPLFPERRLLKESEPRDLVLPAEWLAELLDVMERREQRMSVAVTLFLLHMGCRVGEAIKLTWDRVDLARNRISFVKTKGCMPRTLPIPKEVQPILKAMKARGSERVFPMAYETFHDHYDKAKHEVCDRLQLSDEVRKEWVIHTLRHTCLTELSNRGWGAPAISQWAGHKSLAVTQRYVHGSAINLEKLMEC